MTSGANRRVIAFPKIGNIYTELLYAEVEMQNITVIEGIWSRAWLRDHIHRGDLLHIHWPSFLHEAANSRLRTAVRIVKLYLLLRMSRRLGAVIVWTAHNLYPHEGGAERLSNRLGRRIIVSAARYVIVHGAAAAAMLVQEFHVPRNRLLIGHHPHWIDHYPNTLPRAQCRAQLGVADGEFLYLHIGRCRPYKGLELLIETYARMSPPARLIIAGNFSSAAYFEKISALAGKVPGVQVSGASIPDAELQLYLNAADCVVLPYRAVLTSGTALLALSFGRPVIAPDLGSIRDHVPADSGVLYDPQDPEGLATAMQAIRSRVFDAHAIIERVRLLSWADLASLLVNVNRVAPQSEDI